jgi:hypothetical protein
VTYKSEKLYTPKNDKQRKLHKALMRYHDPENWATLRDAFKDMGRPELIGDGPQQLVPAEEKDQQKRRQAQPTKPGKAARGGQWSGSTPKARTDDSEPQRKRNGQKAAGSRPGSKPKGGVKKSAAGGKKAAMNAKKAGSTGKRPGKKAPQRSAKRG